MTKLEPPFDPVTVARWQTLADQTREAFNVWRHVSDPATPEAQGLARQLRRLLAETVDKKVAEWAFTNWLITKRPIEVCVAEELRERRAWPSAAGRQRRTLSSNQQQIYAKLMS